MNFYYLLNIHWDINSNLQEPTRKICTNIIRIGSYKFMTYILKCCANSYGCLYTWYLVDKTCIACKIVIRNNRVRAAVQCSYLTKYYIQNASIFIM